MITAQIMAIGTWILFMYPVTDSGVDFDQYVIINSYTRPEFCRVQQQDYQKKYPKLLFVCAREGSS